MGKRLEAKRFKEHIFLQWSQALKCWMETIFEIKKKVGGEALGFSRNFKNLSFARKQNAEGD